jgi:energy-coupling factor transporter ATP-binding protein EcfA2
MTKETLAKMLAGLTPDEQRSTLAELAITDAAAQNELMSMAASTNNINLQPPAVTQPAQAQQQPPANQFAGAPAGQPDYGTIMQQLANEKAARIVSDCNAFLVANANKIPPAEAVAVKNMYHTLANLNDGGVALQQYAGSIQSRPAHHMISEQVASSAIVLTNGQQAQKTDAEKDEDLAQKMLAMTDKGLEAVHAVQAGKVVIATPNGNVERPVNLAATLKQFGLVTE